MIKNIIKELKVKDIKITAPIENTFYNIQDESTPFVYDGVEMYDHNLGYLSYVFLVKDNEILAYMNYEEDDEFIEIGLAENYKFKGFYNFIFKYFLEKRKFKFIVSDTQISSSALKAYKKLQNAYKIQIFDYETGEFLPFEPENFKGEDRRISVSFN